MEEIGRQVKRMAIYKKSEKSNPRFDELHLIIALKIISDKKTVGRKRLMEELDIGEGSTRTILDKLKEKELTSSSPNGHKITKKGRAVLKRNMPKSHEIRASDLTLSDENYAILMKGVHADIGNGIEQRDEAIKVGADCAVTLLFDGEKLRFPKDFELKLGRTDAIEEILTKFHPDKGDIIVIGGASNKIKAIKGALAASKALCK